MDPIVFQIVDFTDQEDDVISALYLNGKLVMSGDYYHDKINDRIKGYILGYGDANTEDDGPPIEVLRYEACDEDLYYSVPDEFPVADAILHT